MKLLLLMCLLIYSSIHTAQTVIFSQNGTEGRDVSLVCVNVSKVIWSKGTDGGRSAILSAEDGEITQKHRPDPENRYSVLNSDSSLVIKSVSLSDSGIYYCNSAPVVNLTVNPAPPAESKTTMSTTRSSSGSDDESSPTAPPNVTCCSSVSSSQTDRAKGRRNELPAAPLTSAKASRKKPQTEKKENRNGRGENRHRNKKAPSAVSNTTLTPASAVINSESKTTMSTTRSSSGSDASTKASRKKTQSTTTEKKGNRNGKGGDKRPNRKGYIITIAVLVGVLLVILALFLQRCYFKRKAARATKTDHVYEIVNDSAPTTQPASSPPKEYEAIYVLAGDPDIIKLGLKNQSAASPLVPQAQSTENNPSEPLYSTIQEFNT
ncbi:uncharacterized protein LOC118800144 [Colossoma macropomum]|uniref:uncharacterized protein LOC118800144 n=1 Tax=Colossoma macropomum TaxID=42526 RepID=UPI001863DE15|nr:uncharacterized protein LOC118800144 [Colossoma macropomum]